MPARARPRNETASRLKRRRDLMRVEHKKMSHKIDDERSRERSSILGERRVCVPKLCGSFRGDFEVSASCKASKMLIIKYFLLPPFI